MKKTQEHCRSHRWMTAVTVAVAAVASPSLAIHVAHADVIPVCVPIFPAECSDGRDNDGDNLVDYGSSPVNDPECDAIFDGSERLNGVQPIPCFVTRVTLIHQFLPVIFPEIPPFPPEPPFPPGPCLSCPPFGLEFVDVTILLERPIEEVIVDLHPDWRISVHMHMGEEIEGVVDNPNLPNLMLHYVGQELLGPGSYEEVIKFSEDALLSTTTQFVGRGIDVKTNEMIPNVGMLGEIFEQ